MPSLLDNWKYERVFEEDFVDEENLNGFHRCRGAMGYGR